MKYILEYNSFIGYFEIEEKDYNKFLYGDDGDRIAVNDKYFNEKYMYRLRHIMNNFTDMGNKEEDLAKGIFNKSYVKRVDIIQNLIPINWRNKKNLPKDIDLYVPSDFKLYSLIINNLDLEPSFFIKIIKNVDGWYFVHMHGYIREEGELKKINKHFKCDQIDGLKKFLLSVK